MQLEFTTLARMQEGEEPHTNPYESYDWNTLLKWCKRRGDVEFPKHVPNEVWHFRRGARVGTEQMSSLEFTDEIDRQRMEDLYYEMRIRK